ncbi:MAG: Wzz/FepE/Etk N-terminal domain-containing protein, partial [Nocardioidaceae bacterium]
MGEQSVDLRSTLAILRRNRRTLMGAAALGAAAGACSVLLWPPMYTSTSQVLLPQVQDSSGQAIERDAETEIRIASSDAVLGEAGKTLDPRMSRRALDRRVEITAPTTLVLQIEASAETPDRAEQMSHAVATAEEAFVKNSASSLTGTQEDTLNGRLRDLQASLDTVNKEIQETNTRKQITDPASAEGRADATALANLTAQAADLVLKRDDVKNQLAGIEPSKGASIIQDASPAERPMLAWRYVVSALLGLVAAVVLAAIGLTIFGRRDRRLRYRDEIADAVGSAVIASIRSRVPRAVAGWTSLLESYDPGTVDAWALRQALRQLVFGESASGPRRAEKSEGKLLHPSSITVITLSEDLQGLAMGPQIASYAASAGLRTRLVAAQRHESTAALWAACSQVSAGTEIRPGLLVGTGSSEQSEVDLTVVLAVVDRHKPELVDLPDTSVTILAVSSGSATAEDLAQAAVTADDAGSRIDGIVVADPDDLDRTTGRLLQHERSQQVPL